jgi:hypothetical protein
VSQGVGQPSQGQLSGRESVELYLGGHQTHAVVPSAVTGSSGSHSEGSIAKRARPLRRRGRLLLLVVVVVVVVVV